jgi:hypothetical protein
MNYIPNYKEKALFWDDQISEYNAVEMVFVNYAKDLKKPYSAKDLSYGYYSFKYCKKLNKSK